MKNDSPDWLELIGVIYDAALDDALWTPAIKGIMEQVGASQSWMITPIIAQADSPQMLAQHAAEDLWPLYMAYYWQRDQWGQNGARMGLLRSGTLFHGDEAIPRNEFRHTEIYEDLLKPRDIEIFLCATLFGGTPEQPTPTCLSLFRRPGAEAFSSRDEQIVQHLLAHLQRSLRIRWRMGQQNEARCLREAALDRMAQAVALLDEQGRLLFANSRAEAVFRAGDGLAVVNGRLTATGPQGNGRLQEALRRALLGSGSSVRLDAGTGQPCRVATFCPLRVPSLDVSAKTRVLVLIASPAQPAADGLPAFAALYGLTPAETRVLGLLLEQRGTQDIADALNIRIKTLRIHLSNLYAKTGTASQRELVAFFLAHPISA